MGTAENGITITRVLPRNMTRQHPHPGGRVLPVHVTGGVRCSVIDVGLTLRGRATIKNGALGVELSKPSNDSESSSNVSGILAQGVASQLPGVHYAAEPVVKRLGSKNLAARITMHGKADDRGMGMAIYTSWLHQRNARVTAINQSIALCGKPHTVLYQKGGSSITSMASRMIIGWRTCKRFRESSMARFTSKQSNSFSLVSPT